MSVAITSAPSPSSLARGEDKESGSSRETRTGPQVQLTLPLRSGILVSSQTMSPKPAFQAQLSAFPLDTDEAPSGAQYREAALFTEDPKTAFRYLERIEWGFSEADTRFMGHDLHPYPAKFIPQIPGTIISLLSARGDLVLDPFGGSGTTALEAVRLGRRAISVDANPVAALIGKVKTARISRSETAELHLLHGALRAYLETPSVSPSALLKANASYAPVIANREKWFSDAAFRELAHIRGRILSLSSEVARNIALLALSRTVLSASFQDSETRYKSVPRSVSVGETTRRFVREFESVMRSVARNEAATRYGVSQFLIGDARELKRLSIADASADLVVTSPPYGNATDYHLYHRFRLLWLGYDPVSLGHMEIGSHLKHQREGSGFESYFADIEGSLAEISRVLKNGRFAALVIGDSVYNGKTYETAQILAERSLKYGFDSFKVIDRELPKTRRSFTPAGRRASKESILFLRKNARETSVKLIPAPYKLWRYEGQLDRREREALLGQKNDGSKSSEIKLKALGLTRSRALTFTHYVELSNETREPTWQAILENGASGTAAARKDPKYVTHGIHPYKGKFYPQLAKGLINQLALPNGAAVLDPFCGSGTTLLEGYLNGLSAFGCDLHPLAAKIASAKTVVLEVSPDLLSEVVSSVLEAIETAPKTFQDRLDQFKDDCHEEIERWFAPAISRKLNWLLSTIRNASSGPVRDFLEVVYSSIVREVSHQDPKDLRIRYRKSPLRDADVLGKFRLQLEGQFARVEKFWKARGYSPHRFHSVRTACGDNRHFETFEALGLKEASIDLILTSPPYAMALPYIDTDRLSLLLLMGLNGSERRPLEQQLIGSREITTSARQELESDLCSGDDLPAGASKFVRNLLRQLGNADDAGFRKQNMPSLLFRFLRDMDAMLLNAYRLCKKGAEAMIVIGDSRMSLDDREIRIPTTDFVEELARHNGFKPLERFDISVSTENLLNMKNAITENVVLRLKK
jgi:DNA modification methylase